MIRSSMIPSLPTAFRAFCLNSTEPASAQPFMPNRVDLQLGLIKPNQGTFSMRTLRSLRLTHAGFRFARLKPDIGASRP